jgi:hypothetical protein
MTDLPNQPPLRERLRLPANGVEVTERWLGARIAIVGHVGPKKSPSTSGGVSETTPVGDAAGSARNENQQNSSLSGGTPSECGKVPAAQM